MTAARWEHTRRPEMGIAEMLHHIRASVRDIQLEALRHRRIDRTAVMQELNRRLASAILHESPFDIAVILGSGAEFRCIPDDRAMARCIHMVQAHGGKTMRAVVWAVRHRCAGAGSEYERFAVDGC